jgi:diguanylate cyclase (GGDEF)-like protein/PAS domain S-box-containing protein
LYCSSPNHHFTDLTLETRRSGFSEDDWALIESCRRRTLQFTKGANQHYLESQVIELHDPEGKPEIRLLLKEVTNAVTEHLTAERHRQAEDLLREANTVLEEKIRARTRELHQTLEKLRTSEQRFALAALGSNDGLWDWNLETNTVHLSPRWKEIIGYADRAIPNTLEAWYGLVVPEDLSALKQALEAHFAGGTASFEHEYRMQHKDGSVRWVLTRGAAIRNQAGAPLRIAGSQTDITPRKSTELNLRHDAMHDALTGLPNRATFRLKVAEAMHRRDEHEENFAILFLDLDGFKAVNDTLGHLVGDQILIGIARRMEGVVRPGDVVARLGGDEFIVLLNHVTGKSGVDAVAERILGAFEQPFAIQGQQITIGGSIGIALGRKQFKTPEEIIRKADSAMYHVKMAKKKT